MHTPGIEIVRRATRLHRRWIATLVLAGGLGAQAIATAGDAYSPYLADTFPTNLYWGDTHLHTVYSVDAAVLGETRLTPEQAYRFARGETVRATSGQELRIGRPLDFLVVSDHAEYLGLLQQIQRADPLLLESPTGKRWHEAITAGGERLHGAMFEILTGLGAPDRIGSSELRASAWQLVTANADRFNDPGRFTAFIGYEWTSSTATGDNLHRNVIFRDGADHANRVLPHSAQDGLDPESLWRFLARYEAETGGQVLAIAHNGNLSNGRMFSGTRFNGQPLDRDYASTRARWEPVYEVTQIKGDGEAHPALSPEDEFADYETWDTGNLASVQKPEGALPFEYARSALRLGLAHEARLGANPFRFGMIGSTDSHTGLATAEESNFWGKFSTWEPGSERIEAPVLPLNPQSTEHTVPFPGWKSVASGYAAVWAHENSRAAIFDALRRKETYATTGPRIGVRFFGGWEYAEEDIERPDFVRIGYRKGVPMGGELPARAEASGAPVFLLSALKDPDGANLDRLQIVKGWLDAGGSTHERVYDVAVSDGRRIGRDGRARKPVGSTVDAANATYRNSIGAVSLAAHWRDPEFDPRERAFYYVRVIEIPTPRWTAFDAKRLGKALPPEAPTSTQERAYTSPIWYTPDKKRQKGDRFIFRQKGDRFIF